MHKGSLYRHLASNRAIHIFTFKHFRTHTMSLALLYTTLHYTHHHPYSTPFIFHPKFPFFPSRCPSPTSSFILRLSFVSTITTVPQSPALSSSVISTPPRSDRATIPPPTAPAQAPTLTCIAMSKPIPSTPSSSSASSPHPSSCSTPQHSKRYRVPPTHTSPTPLPTITSSCTSSHSISQSVSASHSLHTISPSSPRFLLPYEPLVWSSFLICTILVIVDRFLWNVWPRDNFAIGAGTAGSDFFPGLKPGPWTVQLYDIVARITGRYSILALNLLLFTTMHTLEAYLPQSPLAKLIDFSHIITANRRLHVINGVLLCLLTLIHVWSVLLPSVFSGWSVRVVVGLFEFPLSERPPEGFKDVDVSTNTMNLEVDDVFRIVEMTVLLGILMPLSIRWLRNHWHIGIHLHRVLSVLYFVDIVRRHTHPHSWIFNIPMFIVALLDALLGVYWRRFSPTLIRERIGHDYFALYWDMTENDNVHLLDSKFYLRLLDHSLLERAHAFTAFRNVTGMVLPFEGQWTWSHALLIRVHREARRPRLGRRDARSHTHRVATTGELNVEMWGPFAGGICGSLTKTIENGEKMTVVGGGSAGCYLLDVMQWHLLKGHGYLTVLYCCRDAELFDWIFFFVVEMLIVCGERPGLRVVIALTGGEQEELVEEAMDETVHMARVELYERRERFKCVTVRKGRIEFAQEIEEEDVVFVQGPTGLRQGVSRACRQKGARLVTGAEFDQNVEKRGVSGKLRRLLSGKQEV